MSTETLHSIKMPPPEKAPRHTGNIIAWMWYFLLPYKWIVIGFFSYRTVRYTYISLTPALTGYVIDGLESGQAQANPGFYIWFVVGYFVIYALSLVNVAFIPEVRVFEKAARAMTLYSINHLNALSLSWHEAEGSGGKLQRVMTGRKSFQEFSRHVRWDCFPLIGGFLAITFTIHLMDVPFQYGPYFVLFVITYLFASWYFARTYFKLFDQFNDKFERLLSGVYEFVGAVRTVKAFHLNNIISGRAMELEEVGQEAIMRTFSTNLFRWTMCNLIATFWLFIFVYVGFQDVLNGSLSIGAYSAVIALSLWIWGCCEIVGSIWEKIYEHGNGVHRLVQTLRVEPKQLDIEPLADLPQDWQSIAIKDLSFSYDAGEDGEPLGQGVYDIDFAIQRGEKIALVGPSGAGKSTMVKLIMKQTLAQKGAVEVDGVNLQHLRTGDWLSQIGFVPQDVELFNMSIRENILLGMEDIGDAAFREVLELSALAEFIDGLEEGDQTMVGERGIKLSGGQRQRVGIARASARQAELIIFDEATSSLDSLSEAQIQKAIEQSFAGHTLLIIAHRLSTVRHVDRIIVLDQGQMIEQGSFDALLKKKGLFARLWAMQA